MIGIASNARAIAETYRSLAGMADAIDSASYRSMAKWWIDQAEEVEVAQVKRSLERTHHLPRHVRSVSTNGSKPGR